MTFVRRAGAVVLLGAVSLYLTAGRGVSPGDASGFLLVAKRVADGDDLYRDVIYSPLPLAVYVTAAPVALFGARIAIEAAGRRVAPMRPLSRPGKRV